MRLLLAMPWLRQCGLARTAKRLRNKTLGMGGPRTPLRDPWDIDELEGFLATLGLARDSGSTAAGMLLQTLIENPDWRRRFPGVLASGPDGLFAKFLLATQDREDAKSFTAALAERPGLRAQHYYEHEWSIRDSFPLALTPGGWTPFAHWLLRKKPFADVGFEEVLWFLLERADDPSYGVEATYRRIPIWQRAVPEALESPAAWERLKGYIARKYRVREDWLRDAAFPKAAAEPGEERGVNILGHFRYPSGLQVACRNAVDAFTRVGTPVSIRDVPTGRRTDELGRDGFLGMHPHPVTISTIAPVPLRQECYDRAGLTMRPGVHRIGYWYWELEEAPRNWRKHERWLHELWAPTRFIGDALRKVMSIPVHEMLPGIPLPPPAKPERAKFGLPTDRYLFLFVFDMCSLFDRKNPLAVVRAFRKAFRADERAALAIKVSRGSHDAGNLAILKQECETAGVHLIDQVMPLEDLRSLMAGCDAYVSLHRSEGFGLTIAEAMAMGKPAIASAYSGNLDFMTADDSLLVECRRARVLKTVYPYVAGSTWCEPDVDHGAKQMRRLFDNQQWARELGQRGKQAVETKLSLEAAGRRMAARLDELHGERKKKRVR